MIRLMPGQRPCAEPLGWVYDSEHDPAKRVFCERPRGHRDEHLATLRRAEAGRTYQLRLAEHAL